MLSIFKIIRENKSESYSYAMTLHNSKVSIHFNIYGAF